MESCIESNVWKYLDYLIVGKCWVLQHKFKWLIANVTISRNTKWNENILDFVKKASKRPHID